MCHLPMERTGTVDMDLGHLNVCIWATYTYVPWIGAKTYGDGASGSWVNVEPHSEGSGFVVDRGCPGVADGCHR